MSEEETTRPDTIRTRDESEDQIEGKKIKLGVKQGEKRGGDPESSVGKRIKENVRQGTKRDEPDDAVMEPEVEKRGKLAEKRGEKRGQESTISGSEEKTPRIDEPESERMDETELAENKNALTD